MSKFGYHVESDEMHLSVSQKANAKYSHLRAFNMDDIKFRGKVGQEALDLQNEIIGAGGLDADDEFGLVWEYCSSL